MCIRGNDDIPVASDRNSTDLRFFFDVFQLCGSGIAKRARADRYVHQSGRFALGRRGNQKEIANAVVRLCTRDAAENMSIEVRFFAGFPARWLLVCAGRR